METNKEERRAIEEQIGDWLRDGSIADDDVPVCKVMLWSVYVGTGVKALSDASGVPSRDILPWHRKLRDANIFTADGTVNADWMEEGGAFALILDSAVARGTINRTRERNDKGEFLYSITPKGAKMVEGLIADMRSKS